MKRPKLPFYPVNAVDAPGTRAALDVYVERRRAPPPPTARQTRRVIDDLARVLAKLAALDSNALGRELHCRDVSDEQSRAIQGVATSMRTNPEGLVRRIDTGNRGRPTDWALVDLLVALAKEFKAASGKKPVVVRNKRGTLHVYEGGEDGDFMRFVAAVLAMLPSDVKPPSRQSIGYYARRVVDKIDDPEAILREFIL